MHMYDNRLIDGPINKPVMRMCVNGDPVRPLYWMMPALAHASHEDRWTLWLAPPFRLQPAYLRSLGFDLTHTRIVHRSKRLSCSTELVARALRSCTHAVVLAWPRHCGEQDLALLESAAQEGQAIGLLFLSDGASNHMRASGADELNHPARAGRANQLSLDVGGDRLPG